MENLAFISTNDTITPEDEAREWQSISTADTMMTIALEDDCREWQSIMKEEAPVWPRQGNPIPPPSVPEEQKPLAPEVAPLSPSAAEKLLKTPEPSESPQLLESEARSEDADNAEIFKSGDDHAFDRADHGVPPWCLNQKREDWGNIPGLMMAQLDFDSWSPLFAALPSALVCVICTICIMRRALAPAVVAEPPAPAPEVAAVEQPDLFHLTMVLFAIALAALHLIWQCRWILLNTLFMGVVGLVKLPFNVLWAVGSAIMWMLDAGENEKGWSSDWNGAERLSCGYEHKPVNSPATSPATSPVTSSTSSENHVVAGPAPKKLEVGEYVIKAPTGVLVRKEATLDSLKLGEIGHGAVVLVKQIVITPQGIARACIAGSWPNTTDGWVSLRLLSGPVQPNLCSYQQRPWHGDYRNFSFAHPVGC